MMTSQDIANWGSRSRFIDVASALYFLRLGHPQTGLQL
jgi:hypothetical protein